MSGQTGDRLGIIAGWGELPFMIAAGARRQGVSYIAAVGFQGHTDPSLRDVVDELTWIGVGQINKLIATFKKAGASRAVMAGRLGHSIIFSNIKFDVRMLALVARLKDRKADTILKAIASEIEKDGIDVIDSTAYLKDDLPASGVLTRTAPSAKAADDVEFGAAVAREIARLDIGQTVVVKDRAVLAVEAFEGTDEAMRRGGALGKGKAVAVKVARPQQDMRFDVPVIGPETVQVLKEAKISCLAIEAGKTIILGKERVLKEADAAKIAIVAI
ncbi:MAG TPA: UDP-2,3-diacylglucosamine diphosphatase LpxI [bacterium]|nr:UDP-2,3-diacylglucosamine diphosphatase LpxI [bacterium]